MTTGHENDLFYMQLGLGLLVISLQIKYLGRLTFFNLFRRVDSSIPYLAATVPILRPLDKSALLHPMFVDQWPYALFSFVMSHHTCYNIL